MESQVVTHPIKLYEFLIGMDGNIPDRIKFISLKRAMADLIGRGRVCLTAKFESWYDWRWGGTKGNWCFTTFYVGRKSIFRKGFRHDARKKYKEHLCQPIRIPQ